MLNKENKNLTMKLKLLGFASGIMTPITKKTTKVSLPPGSESATLGCKV